MSGGNDDGIFVVIPYSDERSSYEAAVRWHTGNPETSPWEWRICILNERKDIGHTNVFRKIGYITKEWYPYFLAVCWGTMEFEDEYYDGTKSKYAKRITLWDYKQPRQSPTPYDQTVGRF